MDSIGKGLAEVFAVFATIAIVSVIGCIVFTCYYFFGDDSIKSEHLIKPQIELVIKDNKVDTLYVYRKP